MKAVKLKINRARTSITFLSLLPKLETKGSPAKLKLFKRRKEKKAIENPEFLKRKVGRSKTMGTLRRRNEFTSSVLASKKKKFTTLEGGSYSIKRGPI